MQQPYARVVEKLFLETELAKDHPLEVYGAQVPRRYFGSHPDFEYIIKSGYCHKTIHQLSHGRGFNGFRKANLDSDELAKAQAVEAVDAARGYRRRKKRARAGRIQARPAAEAKAKATATGAWGAATVGGLYKLNPVVTP